jgi:glycosyltransferase involved in cell wall biosynthesis
MTKKAIVCVSNDLSTDQRVHKTCLTLQKCEYEVVEMGRKLHNSIPLERPYRTLRKKLIFNSGPLFYAELNVRFLIHLLFAKVDLIFSNDLDTLLACYLASKIRHKRLIYDSHEYFTETPELIARPRVQQIWKAIENIIFPRLTNVITVNHSIANLYAKEYQISVNVSRNIPHTFEPERILTRGELGLPNNKKIIILQGTGINIQRGAEETVEAMKFVDDVVLLIVGSGDVLPTLKIMVSKLHLEDKVIFKPKMPFSELRQYTINSDLGLAIDKDTNINYHYSLPNKLFDYIHSGIPTLSSGLVELKQIIDKYDIGYYIQNHEPKHIADVIESIFKDQGRYTSVKANTYSAKKKLNWEKEEKVLIEVIRKSEHR